MRFVDVSSRFGDVSSIFVDVSSRFLLQIGGNITGRNMNEFLPNPTLLTAETIKSNLNFQTILEIHGDLIIEDDFNGTTFEKMLENIVYKDEDLTTIHAAKEFPNGLTVRGNLSIASKSINTIPLYKFIRKDSKQLLNIKEIEGNISIENLQLTGLVDGVNITKLDQDSVKISGDQYISSVLNFTSDIKAPILEAQTLNGKTDKDFLFLTSDLSHLKFQNMFVDNLKVDQDVEVDLENFNLKEYNSRRMSSSEEQAVTGRAVIKKVETGRIQAVTCNGVPFGEMVDLEEYSTKIVDKLLSGQLKIRNFEVLGNLTTEGINGLRVEDLLGGCQNFNALKDKESLVVEDYVTFEKLTVDLINNITFDEFANNVIYKNETNVTITGPKIFENGFHVNKFIETYTLNDVPLSNLMTKFGSQDIRCPLVVHGDLVVDSQSEIEGKLNGFSLNELKDFFYFDEEHCEIKGDVSFDGEASIERLEILGKVHGRNVSEDLRNLVYLDEDFVLDGVNTFEHDVS